MAMPTQCITLEEHAVLPSLGDESNFFSEIWKTFPAVRRSLHDLSSGRLADMDAGHVAVQVISALPGMSGLAEPAACQCANDELAEAVRAHPTRFRAFAALPMHASTAQEAARELERAVTELGFVGAMIDDHDAHDGSQYDAEAFWPVFAAAERLDVPLYIHPAPPSPFDSGMARFAGNYPHEIAMGLATGANGWHSEVALHVLKLYAARVFERYPRLKIIVGHNGEMLPIWIDRIDRLKFFERSGLPKFSEVWERNIWVTTSGLFSVRVFRMLLLTTKIERLMYSVDSPFESSATGWHFVEELAKSDILTADEMDMLLTGNARALLKIEL